MKSDSGAMLVLWVTVAADDEEEFNRWYDEEHIPELLAIPGFRSARRLRNSDEPHNYLTIYELESVEVLESDAFLAWKSQAASSQQMLERMVSVSRGVFREIGLFE